MSEVLRCSDPWGRLIVVDAAQWAIKRAKHPELQGSLEAIATTLSDPWEVTYDRTTLDRECFYRPYVLNEPFRNSWLKVCIHFSKSQATGTETGWLVTAFSVPEVHPDEEVKWSSIENE